MNKKGFTLIELMIMASIIGILLSIAVPKFIALVKGQQAPTSQNGRQFTFPGQ